MDAVWRHTKGLFGGAPRRWLVPAVLAALVIAGCAPAKLVGDPLPSPLAPNFTLIDGATGASVTLSELRGQVVVLSFLYTNCPDVCPLTAETLRAARDKLGDAAKDVVFVAVSVDPGHDTPEAIRRFSEAHGLTGTLRYLIGSKAQLAKVWADYGVAQVESGSSVGHTDVIYLIDKRAHGRVILHSVVTPDDLVSDLRTLASER